jgi:hypothetical protein
MDAAKRANESGPDEHPSRQDATAGHDTGRAAAPQPSRRRGLVLAVVGAAAALALGTYLLTSSLVTRHHHPHTPATPTVPVTYAVTGTGTADIVYAKPDGTATITTHRPWHTTTTLPTGPAPATISITLGPKGGHATCTLTLHGRAVQHATAYGPYGRATCRADLTATPP